MPKETQTSDAAADTFIYRPATPRDQAALHDVFVDSVWDLVWRMGIQDGARFPTPQERAEEWQRWKPILDHLTASADQFWVAEQKGEPIGFARSILRDEVRELTEFFVSPTAQAVGIGRELLGRAMPRGARRTYIIATVDQRAQALYHKLGVYQICAVYTFHRKLESGATPTTPPSDLTIVPITPEHIPMLAKIDQATHGFARHDEHKWLMSTRSGFLLLRDQRAVGYGYVANPYSGPFALISRADYPAALAHAESLAAAQGITNLGFDIPMLNRNAIAYLLGRGYQMSQFFCFYMCDQQPLHVDKTIITAPMILI
jgi:GNAT superfamily N-acetyltransferase